MKESILRTAGGILPKEAEIIQIYKARFLILISCKTPQAMETWENRIRQALQSLSWNGKGKSFPLQVMIGAALYSETHAVEDMVALADSRMKADNPQLPEIEKGVYGNSAVSRWNSSSDFMSQCLTMSVWWIQRHKLPAFWIRIENYIHPRTSVIICWGGMPPAVTVLPGRH